MNKCVGCGVTSDKKYCQRCFRLRHYGMVTPGRIDQAAAWRILNKIKPNEHVLLVVDILDIPTDFSFLAQFENVTLVLNKRDLLPSSISDQKLYDYFQNELFARVVIVSSKKNYQLDALYGLIKQYQRNYFVGFVNSGKSTLINKLLENYFGGMGELTTSVMPATTQEMVKITVAKKLQLIDTPGIINEDNINNYLSFNDAKKLEPKKVINPVTYQIKQDQVIVVNEQFYFFIKAPNILVFYFKNVTFQRRYHGLDDGTKIAISAKKELVIPGLGFISVQKPGEIYYQIPAGSKIFVREPLL